ncbi:MAG: LacI family DNA-binding transcriptional regulator [Actinomycetota bacterium]
MAKRDATLHDVAALVGVSPRTVSRVVNGEGGFSAATEAKVRAAIEKLGYRPNLLARGLIRGRSGAIALVGPTMTDPFFPELAEGVQQAAREQKLTMFMASTDADLDHQRTVIETLHAYAIDGAIVFPVRESDTQLAQLAASGFRMITIDLPVAIENAPNIRSDIEDGARQAVTHLVEQGRRRIAFVDGSHGPGGRRLFGFRGVVGAHAPTSHAAPTAAGGMEAMRDLLERVPDLDGVFAYNDLMAIGALRVLAETGRRVPDDVAVVGFDDISFSAIINPALTTVRLDRARIGREAVAQVVALTEGEWVPPETWIPVELVVRESA